MTFKYICPCLDLALAWSDHEEIMLVWLQFCFPIESTISSGFPVISNNDLSLLAKLKNFSKPLDGLGNRWGDSCFYTKCIIMNYHYIQCHKACLMIETKLSKGLVQLRLIVLSILSFNIKLWKHNSFFCE